VRVTSERQLQLSADEIQIVRDFHQHLFHAILRIHSQLKFPPDRLYILPRFQVVGCVPGTLDVAYHKQSHTRAELQLIGRPLTAGKLLAVMTCVCRSSSP
jgi:hypothetical protein